MSSLGPGTQPLIDRFTEDELQIQNISCFMPYLMPLNLEGAELEP